MILENVSADLRATFDSADKHDLPGAGAAFEQVGIRLDIKSPSPAEMVDKLIRHAERGCHAAQSFRQPVPVSLEAVVNGVSKIISQDGL